jgi:hypothetical protein
MYNYRTTIRNKLISWRDKAAGEKLVLLFDEAQFLLEQNGLAFRCIRSWPRETTNNCPSASVANNDSSKSKMVAVAAVFSGTNSALANFYEDLKPLPHQRYSRESMDAAATYFEGSRVLYNPFYDLCTIGCVQAKDQKETVGLSDFENVIPYGRPLFTVMQQAGTLSKEKLHHILKRMLLSAPALEWQSNMPALLSILATHVQMGQTSASNASLLVSKGYGILTSFSQGAINDKDNRTAVNCYFMDHVCSYLAMCLMDAGFKATAGNDILACLPNGGQKKQ